MIEDRKYRDYYLQTERTSEQRRKDLVVAFDEIHELKCKIRGLKWWTKAQTAVIVGAVGLIAWLSNHLYDCMAAVRVGK